MLLAIGIGPVITMAAAAANKIRGFSKGALLPPMAIFNVVAVIAPSQPERP